MSRQLFLTNPDLNIDDIEVVHSSALGQRAGKPIAASSNSGYSRITPIGNVEDGLDRNVRIRGEGIWPRYMPTNSTGDEMSTALETFTTMTALSVTDVKRLALVAVYDRLHLVTLSGDALLSIYVWTATGFVVRNSVEVDHDIQGGIAACGRGDNIYIGIADDAQQEVSFYRFNARSLALGQIAEGALAVNQPTAISMASDGAMFVFLHEYDLGGGLYDVRIAYGGDLSKLRQKAHSFLDMFGGDWTAEGHLNQPFITWNQQYKFVAGMRAGTTTPGKMRFAHSSEGDDWVEFDDIINEVNYPATTAPFGNVKNIAVAGEGRRIFTLRGSSGTLDAAPTNLQMQYFNGRRAWSAEIDADGGLGVLNGTGLAIANWRGTIYGAWASASGAIQMRKWNTLSTLPSDTAGHSTRAIERGRLNFVDGIEDETRSALFFEFRGVVQKDDVFTIPTSYDRRGANVLSPVLGETWRTDDGGEEWIRLDAGVDRKFVLNGFTAFHTNMPELVIEMDDDETFATPDSTVTISAALKTATVTSASFNRVICAADSFLAHEFASRYVWARFSTGLVGVFRVLDNTTTDLIIDGDVSAGGGTVTLFGDYFAHEFANVQTPRRYLRVKVEAVDLPDGYYEIGRVLFGLLLEPRVCIEVGYRYEQGRIVSTVDLNTGSIIATPLNLRTQRSWDVSLDFYENQYVDEFIGFFARCANQAEQLVFWPGIEFSGGLDREEALLVRVNGEIDTPGSESIYTKARIRLLEEV